MKWNVPSGKADTFLVLGVLLLMVTYALTTDYPFRLWLNEHSITISRLSSPVLFAICAVGTGILGVFFLTLALVGWGNRGETEKAKLESVPNRWKLILYSTINLGLVAAGIWTGYQGMTPQNIQNSNPNVLFCAIIVAVLAMFVIATINESKARSLRKPSLHRSPLNWSHDPLQGLFISMLSCLGLVVGSFSRLQVDDPAAVRLFMFYCSLFIGLLLGHIVAYLIYRKRIQRS